MAQSLISLFCVLIITTNTIASPHSAEISLTPLPDSIEGEKRYFISGFALWGVRREFGPNMGVLEFVGEVDDKGTMRYVRNNGRDNVMTDLQFGNDGSLEVDEQNWVDEYGMNVTFIGSYHRAGISQ